jgi:hypothetical protein
MEWVWTPVAGALVIAFVAAAVVRRRFRARVNRLQDRIEDAPEPAPVRPDLPAEVLALAQRLGATSERRGRLARVIQSGEMWLRPDAKPVSFTARQSLAVTEVGFFWEAWFLLGGLPLRIVDYVVNGEGGLEGRLFDTFSVVQLTGSDAAYRGEAMRYLAELPWAPDALLFNPQLDWRVINANTLAVATGKGARRCELRLILNEAGDPVRAEADDRPRAEGQALTPRPWFARCSNFQMIGSRRVPTQGEAGWILDGREFVYWRARIEQWSLEA